MSQENILQVWCGYSAGAAHESLKDKLLQNPSITDVTFSDNLIVSDQKMGWGRTGDDGKQIFMEVLPVTDDFVRFFNLQIIDGRDFRESDNQSETGVFICGYRKRFQLQKPAARDGASCTFDLG